MDLNSQTDLGAEEDGLFFGCWSTLPRSNLTMRSLLAPRTHSSESEVSSPDSTPPNYLIKESASSQNYAVIGSLESASSSNLSTDSTNGTSKNDAQMTSIRSRSRFGEGGGSGLPVLSALRQGLSLASPSVVAPTAPWVKPEIALVDLQNRTSYNISQRNGQRIYGGPPPEWYGPPPAKGSEIFVGKVPRDLYEDKLVPIFESVGKIYELRLMLDFSGSNRGYLFVRYTNSEEAKRAVRELDNLEISPGKRIGVVMSVDNRKLWISGVPPGFDADSIRSVMSSLTEGVTDVKVYPPREGRKGSGYFYVEYENHRMAALARRKLVPGKNFIGDMEITKVDWAEPETEVDEAVMSQVRVLFVRNLSPSTSEGFIKHKFVELSGGNEFNVERVKKFTDYAFVHFSSREAAEIALRNSERIYIDGQRVEVSWSRPNDKQTATVNRSCTYGYSRSQDIGRGDSSSDEVSASSPSALFPQLNCVPGVPRFLMQPLSSLPMSPVSAHSQDEWMDWLAASLMNYGLSNGMNPIFRS